ncbi:hypothetical protein FKM82_008032 [Ascaphus truei]
MLKKYVPRWLCPFLGTLHVKCPSTRAAASAARTPHPQQKRRRHVSAVPFSYGRIFLCSQVIKDEIDIVMAWGDGNMREPERAEGLNPFSASVACTAWGPLSYSLKKFFPHLGPQRLYGGLGVRDKPVVGNSSPQRPPTGQV